MITKLDTIISLIKVAGVPLPFMYGKQSFANAIADDKKFPFSLLDTPLVDTIMLTDTGYIGRYYKLKIFFLWKSELDWTPVQHNELAIKPARKAVNEFILRCQDTKDESGSNIIDEIKEASEMEVINLFDVNASGIILSVTIKPSNYNSACTT